MTIENKTTRDNYHPPDETAECPYDKSSDADVTLLTNKNGEEYEKRPDLYDDELDENAIPCLCSQRWILSYVGFCFGIVFMTVRMNMSLTLPYMVKTIYPENIDIGFANTTSKKSIAYATSILNNTLANITTSSQCGGSLQMTSSAKNADSAEFEWGKFVQSMILSSYFWGYIVTQVPGGWIAGRYGGKRVITVAMSGSAVLTILTPVLARASPYAVIAERFLLGLISGVCMPSMYNLMGAWALPNERSRMVGMIFLGVGIGTVFGIFTSGILCDKGFDNGWGSVFYIHGSLAALFVFVWIYTVTDSPMDHPRISATEKRLLQKYLIKDTHIKSQKQTVSVPWRQMLTYFPFYVICITHGLENMTVYLLSLSLPLFLKETMQFDMQSNGLFSSLPFLSNTVGVGLAGLLADKLVSLKVLSTTAVRKLFQCTACLGITVMIIIPGYMDCTQVAPVIICLCVAMLFEALGQTAGYGSNVIDIAPRYASLIYGFSNSFGTVPGMVAPIMVAALTPKGTFSEWRVVFFITATCAVIGAILFGGFASSELAPWAKETREINVPIDTKKVALKNRKYNYINSYKNGVDHLHSKVTDKLADKSQNTPVVSI